MSDNNKDGVSQAHKWVYELLRIFLLLFDIFLQRPYLNKVHKKYFFLDQ